MALEKITYNRHRRKEPSSKGKENSMLFKIVTQNLSKLGKHMSIQT